jgi:catechol 2,3-dioxygenase
MNAAEVAAMGRPKGLPFHLNKIGHLALYVQDLQRSARFYTEVLGFQVSDVYAEDAGMLAGGAVFVRLNADHHGIALFKASKENRHGAGLHHIAFEVSTLDEVLRVRDHLRKHDVRIHFEGRRRAGVQLAVEFQDPDGHNLEIYWGIDQIGSDGRARPAVEWSGKPSIEAAIAAPVPGQDVSLRDPTLMK